MSRLRLVSLCLVLSFAAGAPLTGAQPVPFVEAEYVSSWRAFLLDEGLVCSAYDPAVRLLEVPTLTTLEHEANGAFSEYVLAIRPAEWEACPDITLSFTSSVAWTGGVDAVAAECGLVGELAVEDYGDYVRLRLDASVSAACDAGYAGALVFEGQVVAARPAPNRVCVPVTPVGYHCRNVPDGVLPSAAP